MKKLMVLLSTSLFALSLNVLPLQAQASPITVEHSSYQAQSVDVPSISFAASADMDHGTTLFGLPLNEGPIDRSLRAVVALGLIGTGVYGLMNPNTISAPISYTLLGVSAIPTLTAATGYCPLYQLFGLDYSF